MARVEGKTLIVSKEEVERFFLEYASSAAPLHYAGSYLRESTHLRLLCRDQFNHLFLHSDELAFECGLASHGWQNKIIIMEMPYNPTHRWRRMFYTDLARYINHERPRPKWINKHHRGHPFVEPQF